MPTTSNFGWTTPADTDLVKDGAAAIRTLGNGIDTSLVDLKGGTTGQVLSKNSNTDLDFTWTNAGDITEVTAGTGISGGGTSGAVTITNSMATAIDAKGDLIVGTGADTFSRLAVGGTNDHVLTVDSSTSTGMKWAAVSGGGMTLISTTTLTGSTVSLTSIPNTYNDLNLIIRDFTTSDAVALRLRMNGDNGSNRHKAYGWNSSNVSDFAFDDTQFILTAGDETVANGLWYFHIPDYKNTDTWKIISGYGFTNNSTNTGNMNKGNLQGVYNQNSAISSLDLFVGSGTMGGTALLYGVK